LQVPPTFEPLQHLPRFADAPQIAQRQVASLHAHAPRLLATVRHGFRRC
jgi:hypothetical protein